MLLTTRVKLVLAEASESALAGVKVALYDRDLQDEDDLLGIGVTDDSGEVLFAFDSEKYTDAEDQPSWRVDALPDLYVLVYDKEDQALLSTRAQTQENKLPKRLVIPIDRELAEDYGLI